MRVELINYTPNALTVLLFTKESRLGNNVTLADIARWPLEKKMETLDYMLKTIKSSFEFVDYIFHIQDVSRAFTHQLVRTRTASFQQESMRAVKKNSSSYVLPDLEPAQISEYEAAIADSFNSYEMLVQDGVQIQDARGVLPIATSTSILIKANLRTLSQMAEHRLCVRTQGEYQNVFKLMKKEILEVHPWAEPLLQAYCVQNGICCFPNYKKCPVQPFTMPITDSKKQKIKDALDKTNHVANPVAKNGRTM